jgi:hypothetical protein
MGNMHTRITARQFCELQGKDPDTIRMRFAKLRKTNPLEFPDSWQIDGELSEAQVSALIEAGKRKGGAIAPAIDTDYKGEVPVKGEILKEARPNEVAPTLERNWWAIGALAFAFIFPTVASGVNTFSVSHQLSKNEVVSYAVLLMVSLTPILFIVARMQRVGLIVAVGVVLFEGFCNVAATYLSLMGSMVYMFGAPRGNCSDFLQNVVELTNSGHKQTAVCIAIVLAVLIAATQLTAFIGIKKRF